MTGQEESKRWTAENIKVREYKVAKEPVQEAPKPVKKADVVRWYKGHKLLISSDGFCNIKCEYCGTTSRTYITPFEKQCDKTPSSEYCWS